MGACPHRHRDLRRRHHLGGRGGQGPGAAQDHRLGVLGYIEDQYTTLQPTNDRIMATSLLAQWLHTSEESTGASPTTPSSGPCWTPSPATTAWPPADPVRDGVGGAGRPAADRRGPLLGPQQAPLAYDLARFGLDNDNEVFHADDRPYGLIEATIRRDDAPDPGLAFDPGQGW